MVALQLLVSQTHTMRTLLYIHLITMAVWLGGQIFLAAVIVPALRGEDPERRQAVFRTIGRWFGMVSIPVLLVLIITGGAMMSKMNVSPADVPALQHKLEALGVVLVGTVLHSIAGAKGKRKLARAASMITLVSTLAVVWFATGL
jgi:putative copper export protein